MDQEIDQNNLDKLINMGDKISLADLLNPKFMAKYTDFETIQDLIQHSAFKVKTEEDFREIPEQEWDEFIASNTSFESWKAMQIKAFEVYTDNILLS